MFVCSPFVLFFNMFQCLTFKGYSCRIAFECFFCLMKFVFLSSSRSLTRAVLFSLSHLFALHSSCQNFMYQSISVFIVFKYMSFIQHVLGSIPCVVCVSVHCTLTCYGMVWQSHRRMVTGYKYVYRVCYH